MKENTSKIGTHDRSITSSRIICLATTLKDNSSAISCRFTYQRSLRRVNSNAIIHSALVFPVLQNSVVETSDLSGMQLRPLIRRRQCPPRLAGGNCSEYSRIFRFCFSYKHGCCRHKSIKLYSCASVHSITLSSLSKTLNNRPVMMNRLRKIYSFTDRPNN